MLMTTYAGLLRPAPRRQALLYDAVLVTGLSLLIGLSAQVAVRLPFSPVPVTAQTLAVLLAGLLLGGRRGALCVLLYLCEGTAGLPVFAGGASGPVYLLGPTGGYLLGFVVAAWLVGSLAERGWDRRSVTTVAAMLLGSAVIYIAGAAWLARYVGAERALSLGVYPFIPGDAVKIALAALFVPAGWRAIGHLNRGLR